MSVIRDVFKRTWAASGLFCAVFVSNTALAAEFTLTGHDSQCLGITSNNELAIKNENALRQPNGEQCTRASCNDPSTNYLRDCQAYVHADCLEINGIANVAGFHQGVAEGGASNNHYWDSMESVALLTLGGLDDQNFATVRFYDNADCSNELATVELMVTYQRDVVALRSYDDKYMVAEGSNSLFGTVNANRSAIGPWERFEMLDLEDGTVAFKSIHGAYMVAIGGGGGEIAADRTSIGPWERFEVVALDDGLVRVRTLNGYFLTATGDGRVNASSDGSSQTFADRQDWQIVFQ